MPDVAELPPVESVSAAHLAGKARRVLGTFTLMVGGGIVLESRALWLGTAIVLAGAVLFAWGMIEAGDPEPLRSGQERTVSPAATSTEGRV